MNELTSGPPFTPAANAHRSDRTCVTRWCRDLSRTDPRRELETVARHRRLTLDPPSSTAEQEALEAPAETDASKPLTSGAHSGKRAELVQRSPTHPLAPVQAMNTELMPTTQDRPLARRRQRCVVAESRFVAEAIARYEAAG